MILRLTCVGLGEENVSEMIETIVLVLPRPHDISIHDRDMGNSFQC